MDDEVRELGNVHKTTDDDDEQEVFGEKYRSLKISYLILMTSFRLHICSQCLSLGVQTRYEC